MSQTTYPQDVTAHIAGQVVERGRTRGRYECSEDLPAGRMAEYDSGSLRLPQGLTTALNAIGFVPYRADIPPGGYTAGAMLVPVQRTGQMWVEYAGTAPTPEAAVNIMHSSTTAANRGKVTGSATATTAGAEITAIEGVRCVAVDTTNSLALVEFNLPS